MSLSLIICFSGYLQARQDSIRFHHITLQAGLSQNTVSCITQDSMGFIWFGTQDGLNKYDGYGFDIYRSDTSNPKAISDSYILSLLKDRNDVLWIGTFTGGLNKYIHETDQFIHFQNKPDDPNSISNNYVSSLYESSEGALWIGTYAGLNRFDPQTEQFTRYLHEPENPNSLSHDHVHAICGGRDGMLWIGTDRGLNKYDQKNHQYTRYFHQSGNPRSLSHDTIRSIYQDSFNSIWIGTDSGLNRYDLETDQFIRIKNDPNDLFSLSDDHVKIIFEDSSNTLWIGTDRGLNKYDRTNNRFHVYKKNPHKPYSLNDDSILYIYEDQTAGLWLGTYGGGGIRIDRIWKDFKHYTYRPRPMESLSSNIVQAIFTDPQGDDDIIWIGTQRSGIDVFDREKDQITNLHFQADNPNSLSSDTIRAICIDSSGLVWIGTQGNGLNRFDPQKQQFKHYVHNPNDPNSLSHDYIRVIHEDYQGILWIGTYEGGINRFDKTTEQFTSYTHQPDNPNSLSHNRIIAIHEDSNEDLWIGTSFGLNKFDKETGLFTHYTHNPNDLSSLSNNRVQSIYEDKSGILWVGTYGGGLNRFDRKTGKFTRYQEEDNLPNNVVYGILEDHTGYLWLSTNKGLSKFNPRSESFRNYDIGDGLQSNEFNAGAAHISPRGEMFFGGIDGLNAFYPETIKDNPFVPPVVITNFQLFNKPVGIGEESPLKQHINVTQEITLSYNDRVISFEFAALNYICSEKNRFKYLMENFDSDWTEVNDRNFVSYTSLPPGNYTFRVKGSNNDGLWNEDGASLKIRITPPFWLTWWFRGIALLTLPILIFAVFWFRIRAIRERAKELEIRVADRTNELDQTNRELQQEIIERKRAEQELRLTKFSVDRAGEAVFWMGSDARLIYVNETACQSLGYSREELLSMWVFNIDPNFPEEAWGKHWQEVKERSYFTLESVHRRKDGKVFPVEIMINYLEFEGDAYNCAFVRDTTKRKAQEKKIQDSLREKEVLLKEIHHRVKNNMQIISSILRIQSGNIQDKAILEIFHESQNRIRSMALIHETLYQSEDLAKIDFSHYIQKLTSQLSSMYRGQTDEIKFKLDVQDTYLDLDRAIPCGLIINELVSNSLKHAFSGIAAGTIEIKTGMDKKKKFTMIVSDNGGGISETIDIYNTDTLGMQLTMSLVSQLDGNIELHREKGTAFTISFYIS